LYGAILKIIVNKIILYSMILISSICSIIISLSKYIAIKINKIIKFNQLIFIEIIKTTTFKKTIKYRQYTNLKTKIHIFKIVL
jgi:hypothetical protein